MKTGATIFSLMGMLREDYFGTLQKLADTGCKYIEYVTTPNDADGNPVASPEEIGRRVKEMGLIPVSSHVHFDANYDSMMHTIETNIKMGAPRLVLPFDMMNSIDEIKTLGETCNEMGRLCKENGLEFYYHNHVQEFIDVEGKLAFERFMEATDPALVQFQLDCFWAKRAGQDPLKLLDLLGERCTMIHQKDLAADANMAALADILPRPVPRDCLRQFRTDVHTKVSDIVAVGKGVLDVPGIVKKAKELGHAKYIIVELDNINDVDAVQYSLDYLNSLV